MRGFFMCFSRLGDAGSGQVEKRRSPRASGGAAATRAKASLRAGAAAARGFRPPRGFASCSNTRARYIHVPLGRNPLAATSFAKSISWFRWATATASVSVQRRDSGSTKPQPQRGERRGGAGIGRKQAMDGLRSPVGAMDGATRRCARSPHCRGSPPKPTNSGALTPNCRGSRRSRGSCSRFSALHPKPTNSSALRPPFIPG